MSIINRYSFIILSTLCIYTNSLSESDASTIFQRYQQKSSKWHERLQGLSSDFFSALRDIPIMSSVSRATNIAGAGSGGFIVLGNYKFPDSQKSVPAAIKIIPDNKDASHFYDNLILASLTGNKMEDIFDSQKIRNFSFNKSEMHAFANLQGVENPYSSWINKFYEMQYVKLNYSNGSKTVSKYVTILITEPGISNMHRVFFTDKNKKKSNTKTFNRLVSEMIEGARNINLQGILHGDIKPENLILIEGLNKKLHLAYIDFDLCLDPKLEDLFNTQLRYTSGFRAPWLKEIKVMKDVESKNGEEKKAKQKTEIYYQFDSGFREDTYALGKTIIDIVGTNINFLDTDDDLLGNIVTYVKKYIITQASIDYTKIPTTEAFYNDLNIIKKALEEEKANEVNQKADIKKPSVKQKKVLV